MVPRTCPVCSQPLALDELAGSRVTCRHCGKTLLCEDLAEAERLEISSFNRTGRSSDCPSKLELLAFLEDSLPADTAESIEQHVERCDICEQMLSDLVSDDHVPGSLPMFSIPTTIGRYRVEQQIGSGGFGDVFRCVDEELQRTVAIKVARTLPTDADSVHLRREAQLLASLEHENIVKIFDSGTLDDGRPYIVSQFIEGLTLDRYWNANRSWEDATRIILALADALNIAHQHRIVHRDIKPSNILVRPNGSPVLVDFGIALSEHDYGDVDWQGGTLGYLSPEQASGEGHLVDGRSDIFSLGIVFYELLTGYRPFSADTPLQMIERVKTVSARPPRQTRPNIPAEIERICLKCLEKRPGDRYSNAFDLMADLRDALAPTQQTNRNQESAAVVVPRGLRSFETYDADFYLTLVPGPRDAKGFPDSISFWLNRIHSSYAHDTFRVGVLYGPSGSGKSSFIKAGIIPWLRDNMVKIYVDATGSPSIEARIVAALSARFSFIDASQPLDNVLRQLRVRKKTHPVEKIIIFVDQFEHWLEHQTGQQTFVSALRQCDGHVAQCVLAVRDEYWLALTRFLREIDVEMNSFNSRMIDLFDKPHARQVLVDFGKAYKTLPSDGVLERAHQQFLDQCLEELANEDGRLIPVQLAICAEMLKLQPWTKETLSQIGGVSHIGIRYLDQAFSHSAAPGHRALRKPAVAVLKALLPRPHSHIRGSLVTAEELRRKADIRSTDTFRNVVRLLDSELRLITAVEDEQAGPSYQLTHDFMVKAVRDWTEREERQTFRGRARLLLDERASAWNEQRSRRQLPTLPEFVRIRLGTKKLEWNEREMRFMSSASRYHIRRTAMWIGFVAVILIGILFVRHRFEQKVFHDLVQRLDEARPENVLDIVRAIDGGGARGDAALSQFVPQSTSFWPAFITMRNNGVVDEPTIQRVLHTDESEFVAVQQVLADRFPRTLENYLQRIVSSVDSPDETDADDIAITNAAILLRQNGRNVQLSKQSAAAIARHLVTCPFTSAVRKARYFQDETKVLASALLSVGESADSESRESAREILLALPELPDEVVASLTVDQDDHFFHRVLPRIKSVDPILHRFNRELATCERSTTSSEEKRLAAAKTTRAAAAILSHPSVEDALRQEILLRIASSNEPLVATSFVSRAARLVLDVSVLLNQFQAIDDHDELTPFYVTVLATFSESEIEPTARQRVLEKMKRIFRHQPDAGAHAAARSLLTSWKEQESAERIMSDIPSKRTASHGQWFKDVTGMTMIVLDVRDFEMGSRRPEFETERRHRRKIHRTIAMASHEVTNRQYQEFLDAIGNDSIQRVTSLGPTSDCPRLELTWENGAHFCNWLSQRAGIEPSEWCYRREKGDNKFASYPDAVKRSGYRMPTEAEWEFACRAGTDTEWFFGDDPQFLGEYGWFEENSGGVSHPVAQLRPNRWGFFDFYGNALEWCHGFPYTYTDTASERSGSLVELRAQRGGHFNQKAKYVRSAIRYSDLPHRANPHYGLRIVRTIAGGLEGPPVPISTQRNE